MSIALLRLILAARFLVATLAPLTDERAELADAIALAVFEAPAFYRDDPEKLRTLALDVAVAFREGSLLTSAIGDGGHSYCAFQIHDSSGGVPELARDPLRCARAGHAMLRASIKICREHPIAWYAEGPRGCESARAQRISADRVRLASRLAARLRP